MLCCHWSRNRVLQSITVISLCFNVLLTSYPAIEWLEGDQPGAGIYPSGNPLESPQPRMRMPRRGRATSNFSNSEVQNTLFTNKADDNDIVDEDEEDVDIIGTDSD